MPPRRGHQYVLEVACTFSGWVEAFPCHKADAFTVAEKLLENMFPTWGYIFHNLQQLRHPLHWANHTGFNKNPADFLELSLSLSPSITRQGREN